MGAGGVERLCAAAERGTGGDHVVDEHDPSAVDLAFIRLLDREGAADVRCARAAEAVAVAVASGRPTRAELEASRPDFVLDSLEEWPDLLTELGLSLAPIAT